MPVIPTVDTVTPTSPRLHTKHPWFHHRGCFRLHDALRCWYVQPQALRLPCSDFLTAVRTPSDRTLGTTTAGGHHHALDTQNPPESAESPRMSVRTVLRSQYYPICLWRSESGRRPGAVPASSSPQLQPSTKISSRLCQPVQPFSDEHADILPTFSDIHRFCWWCVPVANRVSCSVSADVVEIR
jgi:hypothetical protein